MLSRAGKAGEGGRRPRYDVCMRWGLLAAALVAFLHCGGPSAGPPPSSAVLMVEETLHGVAVADPYRWLEDAESAESQDWIARQTAYSRAYLDSLPRRAAIRGRLTEIFGAESISTPTGAGGRYFYSKETGGRNQPVVYMREGLDDEDRVLLDPNAMSEDGTTTVDWYVPSKDGRLLAYGKSEKGTETSTLYILDTASGEHLADEIPKVRFADPQWLKDGSGFYYSRPRDVETIGPGEEVYNRRIYFHKLGADFHEDPLVFGEGLEKAHIPGASLSADERYLLLDVFLGWGRNRLYVRDLRSGKTTALAEDGEFSYSGEIVDGVLYLLTDWEAPRYRIFAVDLRRPGREDWKPIIAESEAPIEFFKAVGGKLIVGRLRDAHAELRAYALDGSEQGEIPLDGIGSVDGFRAEAGGGEAFFRFSSFTRVPAVMRLDASAEKLAASEWQSVASPVDADAFEVSQVFYASRDGAKIPMFVIARKGTPRDGTVPGLLYGYGGFNIALTPAYAEWIFPWIEAGNVLAIANLRGGSEYGEDWHRAGMLGNKQNVFDDFIAAGEFLKAEKYVDPRRLAIHGRSNGGLLMGAAVTQRPDLWRAVVCGVPLLDMLRYDRFRMAKLWVSEYGTAENAEDFQWLRAYSPYHRVEDGAAYPATLIYTADSDSRVDPMHARKMTARMQAATSADRPILLRYEEAAGHGSGKPLAKQVEEWTDIWSFVFAQAD